MADLFTEVPPQGVSDAGGLANFLVPNNTGAIDVLNEYRWTLTDKKGRKETPFIRLTEWRMLQSSFINSARYYATGLAQQVNGTANAYLSRMQGYAGLFDFSLENNKKQFEYTFPYFSDVSNEVTGSWTTLDILEKAKNALNVISPALGTAAGYAEAVLGFAYETKYPRVGIMDRPKLWESSDFRSINVKFPLYNTVEFADIKKNWELCYLIQYQNMFNKRDFITAIPPVFYTVYVPGQFFSIAMYVSNLRILNRGNIRLINFGDGKYRNIPDVYEVDLTLTDMVMPSQNMFRSILDESPVNVQTQIDQGIDSAERIGEELGRGIKRGVTSALDPSIYRNAATGIAAPVFNLVSGSVTGLTQ